MEELNLIKDVKSLKGSDLHKTVEARLREFDSFQKKSNDKWFSELCFCILTANSKAKTAIAIQKELGAKDFINLNQKQLSKVIKDNKHRFHNNKAKYIVEARKNKDIKNKIINLKESEARDWLAKNIKGLGYKEASHFLRNTGSKNTAIIDRHILSVLGQYKAYKKPKLINKKAYFEAESVLRSIADKLNMSLAELDLYLWYMKTNQILK